MKMLTFGDCTNRGMNLLHKPVNVEEKNDIAGAGSISM